MIFELGHKIWYQEIAGFTVYNSTTRLFRDLNAWYHIVMSVDTTQATASR